MAANQRALGAAAAAPDRIPALDGLRALAALAVLVEHHASGHRYLLPLSMLAMDVFFALSGFLVGGLALDAMDETGWQFRFWSRRAFRIWPLYFVVCAVIVATDGTFPNLHPPRWMLWTFLQNFGLIQHGGWGKADPANVTWSLAVEEQWYLLLPLVLTIVPRRAVPFVFTGTALLAVATRLELVQQGARPIVPYVFTIARLDSLSFGVLGAWALRTRLVSGSAVVAAVFLGLALLGLQVNPWLHHDWKSIVLGQTTGALGTAALCVALSSGRAKLAGRLLSWRPLASIGTFSFGVYLISPLVRGRAEGLVWTLLITLPVAYLSYRFFERPIQRAGRRFLDAARPPAQGVAGATTVD